MEIEFRATIEIPDGTPEEDIEKWLKFQLGEVCGLSENNALIDHDLSCTSVYII